MRGLPPRLPDRSTISALGVNVRSPWKVHWEIPLFVASVIGTGNAMALGSYLFLFCTKEDIVVYLRRKTSALGLHLVQA